jgi:hypothetical protein
LLISCFPDCAVVPRTLRSVERGVVAGSTAVTFVVNQYTVEDTDSSRAAVSTERAAFISIILEEIPPIFLESLSYKIFHNIPYANLGYAATADDIGH